MTARSYDRISLALALVLALGVSGFIPGTEGVTPTMPVWLALSLTGAGAIGLYLLRRRCAKN